MPAVELMVPPNKRRRGTFFEREDTLRQAIHVGPTRRGGRKSPHRFVAQFARRQGMVGIHSHMGWEDSNCQRESGGSALAKKKKNKGGVGWVKTVAPDYSFRASESRRVPPPPTPPPHPGVWRMVPEEPEIHVVIDAAECTEHSPGLPVVAHEREICAGPAEARKLPSYTGGGVGGGGGGGGRGGGGGGK